MPVRSLQRRIVFVFVGLLALVMALILLLVTGSNERIVVAETQSELAAGSRVFTLLIDQNRRQLETAAMHSAYRLGPTSSECILSRR